MTSPPSMASSMPIPRPPNTPTPPPNDEVQGLGLAFIDEPIDLDSLSPFRENFRPGSVSSTLQASSYDPLSPMDANTSYHAPPDQMENKSPFNFETAPIPKSPVAKSVYKLYVLFRLRLTKTECWSKTGAQVQAQQYITSDLP